MALGGWFDFDCAIRDTSLEFGDGLLEVPGFRDLSDPILSPSFKFTKF